ncbi:MAG: lycopene beta cyclase [Cyanobacteria bacterium P01_H01_bin.105]
MHDVLVIGSGPAGLAIAAALCNQSLKVHGLALTSPSIPWSTNYGIWVDELDALGLPDLLSHRWPDCVGYFDQRERPLHREYGFLDQAKLQQYLLQQCDSMNWHQGLANTIEHTENSSTVTTQSGEQFSAKLIIDATGHEPAFIQRPAKDNVAYQAAYGIFAQFSKPPIQPRRCVLMDYRDGHLPPEEKSKSPTFLYAMDLGNDIYFLEETSLAAHPAIPFETLKDRLHQRLKASQIEVLEIQREEHCLFPMNLTLPDFKQRVVGFGGAASMVHPATGYMVGALLRRAPILATAIATARQSATPSQLSQVAWKALWPSERLRKHHIYSFGLEALMRFDHPQLCCLFNAFFQLPRRQWSGFLADSLSTTHLLAAMVNMFSKAPNSVRGGLIRTVGTDGHLLWESLRS